MDKSIEKIIGHLKSENENPCSNSNLFAELGFRNALKACELLRDIVRKGRLSEDCLQRFPRCIIEISSSPDPDMNLLNLVRFLDSSSTHRYIFNTICIEKTAFKILSAIFATSNYLTSVLIKNPGLILWLIEGDTLNAEKSFERYLEELKSKVALFSDVRRKINAVKRYRKREILRIAARDLMGIADIAETTSEISRLTDAIIQIVAEISFAETSNEAGLDGITWEKDTETAYSNFAVISLGKLGGRELNYSSDIDLLYIASPNGNPNESEFYTSLAKRITSHLSSPTEEGTMYRVDLRLRPDGESGPLVVNISEHLNYIMRRAQDWERQALLKARFSAGNSVVASRFIANCESVIFDPLNKNDHLSHILAMRQKSLSLLGPTGRERNIKEMPGGIRDIEFIVQAIQLSFGNRTKEIRSCNTLESLKELLRFKLVTENTARILERCYTFYRTIEHRLQLLNNARTHKIPVDDEGLEKLAKRVSLSKLPPDITENFKLELSSCLQAVTELFNNQFKGSEPDLTYFILSPNTTGKEISDKVQAEYLKRIDPSIIPFIKSLAFGDFPKLESRSTREAVKRSLPTILDAAEQTPDAVLTMKNLSQIIKAAGATKTMLDILVSDKEMLRLLVTISSNSTTLSKWLAGNIEWLDSLTEGLYNDAENIDNEEKIGDIYRQKLLFTLCHLPIPENGPREIGPPLCEILKSFVSTLFYKHGGDSSRLAIFSMGSLATNDCKFGRDMDIIAVTDNEVPTEEEVEIIRNMAASSERIRLARIDLRLRPEGEASPIVKTIQRFIDYFENRASTWEVLAYTKCNFLCGNRETSEKFESLLERWLKEFSFETAFIKSILGERRKLEKLSRGEWDTKYAVGTLYDIDYIIAARLFLQEGSRRRNTNTLDAIDALATSGRLEAKEIERLKEAFTIYYLINHSANLHGFTIPPAERKESYYLEYYRKLLSPRFEVGLSFKDYLKSLRKDVRWSFSRFFKV